MARHRGPFEGPILLAWTALGLAGLLAAAAAAHGLGEAGVRAALRATAASSLALFLAAFAAAPLHRLLRRPATAWAVRNRRWLGLSMALSHAVHAAAIATLATRWPVAGAAIDPVTRAVGSLGYVALALLVLTSNDRAVARLGPSRWRTLQRSACWVLWGVFALSYGGGAVSAPGHAVASAALLAVAALRIGTRRARRPDGRAAVGGLAGSPSPRISDS